MRLDSSEYNLLMRKHEHRLYKIINERTTLVDFGISFKLTGFSKSLMHSGSITIIVSQNKIIATTASDKGDSIILGNKAIVPHVMVTFCMLKLILFINNPFRNSDLVR